MPLSHNKSDNKPCDGQLVWGKTAHGDVRRECPMCGYREEWPKKGRMWNGMPRNERPGDTAWVDGQ